MATFGGMIKGLGNMLQDMQPGISSAIKTLDAERQYKLDKQRQADLSGYYASMSEHLSGQRQAEEKRTGMEREKDMRMILGQLAGAAALEKDDAQGIKNLNRYIKDFTKDPQMIQYAQAMYATQKKIVEHGELEDIVNYNKASAELGQALDYKDFKERFGGAVQKRISQQGEMNQLGIDWKRKQIDLMGAQKKPGIDSDLFKMLLQQDQDIEYETNEKGETRRDINGIPIVRERRLNPQMRALLESTLGVQRQSPASSQPRLSHDIQLQGEGMRSNPMYSRELGEELGLPDFRQFEKERQEQELYKTLQQLGLIQDRSKQGFIISEPNEREKIRQMFMMR